MDAGEAQYLRDPNIEDAIVTRPNQHPKYDLMTIDPRGDSILGTNNFVMGGVEIADVIVIMPRVDLRGVDVNNFHLRRNGFASVNGRLDGRTRQIC